ncbi:hypothetical protein cyc_06132 [Cyclospora cayetanensis]|uniref:Uncharacterized protein n=1 Tax=Cyclospora cayetanensis TaxID=88456 RepID=A0A1D3D0C4_9EIME|nr:hypothetical protein cyc_06132 [Cyclospora cayetanensis]
MQPLDIIIGGPHQGEQWTRPRRCNRREQSGRLQELYLLATHRVVLCFTRLSPGSGAHLVRQRQPALLSRAAVEGSAIVKDLWSPFHSRYFKIGGMQHTDATGTSGLFCSTFTCLHDASGLYKHK